MITDEAKEFAGRYGRRIIIGCGMLLTLCCLSALVYLGVGMQRGLSAQKRIEKAVRASFPGFCAAAGNTLVVERTAFDPLPIFNEAVWDVSCEPQRSSMPWPGPAMTVNMLTCVASVPPTASLDWYPIYGSLFKAGQPLPVCP